MHVSNVKDSLAVKEQLRTPEEARAWLRSHGVSVTEFARRVGVSRYAIYRALTGDSKGWRAEAHKAAVALGIKPRPEGEPPFYLEDAGLKPGGDQSIHVANAA